MSEELNDSATATAPAVPAETAEVKVNRVQKVGKVVSNKMDKTIVVEVSYLKKHRLYKKAMRRTSRFQAHDEENSCKMGDMVRIEECRPISKEKHFRLVEVIKRSNQI